MQKKNLSASTCFWMFSSKVRFHVISQIYIHASYGIFFSLLLDTSTKIEFALVQGVCQLRWSKFYICGRRFQCFIIYMLTMNDLHASLDCFSFFFATIVGSIPTSNYCSKTPRPEPVAWAAVNATSRHSECFL